MNNLATKFSDLGTKHGCYHSDHAIDIGRFKGNDYSILIENLGAASVNAKNLFFHHSVTRIFKTLTFARIKGYPEKLESARKVLVIGRLVASHHERKSGLKTRSHWVVAMDQIKMLWALYAEDIDAEDLKQSGPKSTPPEYNQSKDTAFEVDATKGYIAILLGKLEDLPMVEGVELPHDPKSFNLTWATSIVDFNEYRNSRRSKSQPTSDIENASRPHEDHDGKGSNGCSSE